MNNLVFLGAKQLAKQIHAREVSASEVVEAYLNQIERHNSSLNAIVTLIDILPAASRRGFLRLTT